jgi:hypothetical protein
MAKAVSFAEIINTFGISNAMLIQALEQSGGLADFDVAKRLREIAEAEDKKVVKRGKKHQKSDFHILRHVAALIEMHRQQPLRRRGTPAKAAGQLLIASSPSS